MIHHSDNTTEARKTSPVRVCFVIDRLRRAGTELHLLNLIKHLDHIQIAPYLCLLNGVDDEICQQLEPHGVTIVRLGVRRLTSLHAVRQAWRFRRFIKFHHIDVVNTYSLDSARFAAPIAKSAGCRVFGSRRDIGHWVNRRDRIIGRFYYHWFFDKVIANCEAARRSVIEQERVAAEKVLIIPNGINLARFKTISPWRPHSNGKPQKVGMVGNLRVVKGPDLFIKAAKFVIQECPDTCFEIAGGGDIDHYQRIIDANGLTARVKLLGSVADIRFFLSTLDVAVLPSRAEALSNALLEYMAAGRPIVATDVGGNKELIAHGKNGLLTPVEDPIALAKAVCDLLRNHAQAERLAFAAADDCGAFDWDCAAERYIKAFCES